MKKKLVTIMLVISLVALAFAGCGGSPASTEGTDAAEVEPVTLRLASDAPVEHLATELNEWLCEEVAKRTEGRINIEYFPASQLGGYDTVFTEIMMGSIDMGQISWNAAVDERLAAFNTPVATTGWESAAWMLRPDSYLSQFYTDVAGEFGVDFLGWVLEGYMGLGMVKKMTNPKDPGAPKNVQIRVWGADVCIETMSDLGFNTVTVPYAEVPTAIQTGVVDGWIGGTPNMNYAWVGDFITEFYVNYVYSENTAYMISQKTVEKLDPADYEILREVVAEASEMSITKAKDNEENYLQKLQDEYGVEIVRFTEEEIQAQAKFIKETTWPKLESSVSKEVLDGIAADYQAWLDSRE
ncbi:MAG: TRAP transporter substrate-binding protein DctP [Eubacteriales bacterium]|nr:TRAP transporter substrate-binding protein DctP [Eubacteriales bacterium]